MKKIPAIIFLTILFASCSSLSGLFSQKKIYTSIPEGMSRTEDSVFMLNDITYVKEGPLSLPGQDSEWFVNTELPSILRVLGVKSKIFITDAETDHDFVLDIWIHEMEKENAIPRKNTLTVILTVSKPSGEKGEIIFVDETTYSILNSSYAHKVFDLIIKKLSGETK